MTVRILSDGGSQRSYITDNVSKRLGLKSANTETLHLNTHLQQLELADSAESLNSIDILIGSDHYCDFVTGESIRGDFGPTAVKIKLGWLLSGPTNNSQNETSVVSNLVKGRHFVQC